MLFHIVGCGETGAQWSGIGPSIGVNDAAKWGHQLDYLAIFNHPSKFDKEPDRFKTIISTQCKEIFCHTSQWKEYFPNLTFVKTMQFTGRIRKGFNYHSKTSPFVAISLAWNMGATDIVLWGVDFLTHKAFNPLIKGSQREVDTYLSFFKKLQQDGIKVYSGPKEGSVFCKHLPIYQI